MFCIYCWSICTVLIYKNLGLSWIHYFEADLLRNVFMVSLVDVFLRNLVQILLFFQIVSIGKEQCFDSYSKNHSQTFHASLGCIWGWESITKANTGCALEQFCQKDCCFPGILYLFFPLRKCQNCKVFLVEVSCLNNQKVSTFTFWGHANAFFEALLADLCLQHQASSELKDDLAIFFQGYNRILEISNHTELLTGNVPG